MLSAFQDHLIARRRSANTIRLRMVYLRLLARHDLATITTQDLEGLLISHPEWKPETINACIASWSVFFKWAIRNGRLTNNPTEDLERAYVIKRVKQLADDERIRVALETASPRDRAILLLGREGGLRRAEIAALHRDNRAGDWLNFHGKGGRLRRVHIEPTTAAALDAIEGDGYYFPGDGRAHISPDTVYRIVRRNIGTATHSLRRSAITAVYRGSGGDIRMAQEFADHASPNTTAIYIDISDDDMIRAGGYASLAA
jgi:integrase/recombinase XerC